MEEQVDKIAKYLLMGYSEDFARNFYPLLEVWPDQDKCRQALQETDIYSKFKEIRFIGPDTIITHDLNHGRLNISYDENNMITKIDVG
jgi:hypothetical protein